MVKTKNSDRKTAKDCIWLVLPSQWAKVDLLNYPFFADVYKGTEETGPSVLSLEASSIVAHRKIVLGADLKMWEEYEGAACLFEYVETVRFSCHGLPDSIGADFLFAYWVQGEFSFSSDYLDEALIKDVFGIIWCVSHKSNGGGLGLKYVETLTEEERDV